jgi:hypothetical protein
MKSLMLLIFLIGCTPMKQTSPEYIKFKNEARTSCSQRCSEVSSKFVNVIIKQSLISGNPVSFECECEQK